MSFVETAVVVGGSRKFANFLTRRDSHFVPLFLELPRPLIFEILIQSRPPGGEAACGLLRKWFESRLARDL